LEESNTELAEMQQGFGKWLENKTGRVISRPVLFFLLWSCFSNLLRTQAEACVA
jgi:hypothetical protein